MLTVLEFEVAFLEKARRASALPHVKRWEDATVNRSRETRLANFPPGTGHDKFLRGVAVFFVVRASQNWMQQWGEYSFQWRASSTSKMHQYPNATEEEIDEIPSGFLYDRAFVTNYACLKTVYLQRKHHRLGSWKVFCHWIESLPDAELITGSKRPKSSLAVVGDDYEVTCECGHKFKDFIPKTYGYEVSCPSCGHSHWLGTRGG